MSLSRIARLTTWTIVMLATTRLYAQNAQSTAYSVFNNHLNFISLETGSPSAVSPMEEDAIVGLALDPEGVIYGVSYYTDELWRVEPGGGARTLLGHVGVDVTEDSGLTFDACGRLWLVTDESLYEVDPLTGATTLDFRLGIEVPSLTSMGKVLLGVAATEGNRLARIDPVQDTVHVYGESLPFHTDLQGLDFDRSGRLWGLFWNNDVLIPTWDPSIIEIDPRSGAPKKIITIQSYHPIYGNLAVSPPGGACVLTPRDIPTASAPAMLIVLLLISGSAVMLLRLGRMAGIIQKERG